MWSFTLAIPTCRNASSSTRKKFKKAREKFGNAFEAGMGAEAIKALLKKLDLVKISLELREKLEEELAKVKRSAQKVRDLVKRLKVVESLRDSGMGGSANRSEWMVLDCIPVIPPDLRPPRFVGQRQLRPSDLNDLYRRIINRNNRLKKLVDLNAPEVIHSQRKADVATIGGCLV